MNRDFLDRLLDAARQASGRAYIEAPVMAVHRSEWPPRGEICSARLPAWDQLAKPPVGWGWNLTAGRRKNDLALLADAARARYVLPKWLGKSRRGLVANPSRPNSLVDHAVASVRFGG